MPNQISKARVRAVECTQTAFDRLPALISKQEFMDWTGYDRNEVQQEVKAGRIKVHRPEGHVKAKYYKAEVARLGGWKL